MLRNQRKNELRDILPECSEVGFLFYKCRNQGSERLCELPKVTQHVHGRLWPARKLSAEVG